MQFDMRALSLAQRYKILSATVTPRPIAWVASLSAGGVVNLAPYSFFNVCGVEPPVVMLGLLRDFATRDMKDTATNIHATRDFTVSLVSEADVAIMNETSAPVPRGESEVDYARVAMAPSVVIAPPRVASSPVSFECRTLDIIDMAMQSIVLGEVLFAHVADAFVSDAERHHLDTPAMGLVGRTHGSGWYVRGTDQFSLERPRYDPRRSAKA